MINKQSIWFTFLFSIILILSIFYVNMNENSLSDFIELENPEETNLVVNESTELVALRVQSDEEMMETINDLQDVLLSETSDLESKNSAYDELLTLSSNKSMEEILDYARVQELNANDYLYDLEDFITIYENHLHVFNYQKLTKLSDTNIILIVKNMEVNITGENLKIKQMTKQELLINGKILKVEFAYV